MYPALLLCVVSLIVLHYSKRWLACSDGAPCGSAAARCGVASPVHVQLKSCCADYVYCLEQLLVATALLRLAMHQ
jgi:hypothetical protein